MVFSKKVSLVSEGSFFSANVTEKVRQLVKESAIQEGIAVIFYQHTTGAVLVVEHEAGMLLDLERILENLVPESFDYKHHLRGYDTNGASHLRAALMNTSITVPVTNGDIDLGSYQEILVIDFDQPQKMRTLLVKVLGE